MIVFLLCLLALPYLLVPIFIYRNQRFPAKLRIREQNSALSPKSVREALDAPDSTLASAGFLEPVEVVMSGMIPHMRAFIRIYRHASKNIIAQSTALLPEEPGSPVFKTFLELGSRFENGRALVSNNSEFHGAPIEPSSKKVLMFPGIRDVSKLVSLHDNALKGLSEPSKADFPDIGEEAAFLKNITEKSLAEQVGLGALILDKAQQIYRPSMAGAVLFGWYAMWPMSLVRRIMGMLRAKFLLWRLASEAVG